MGTTAHPAVWLPLAAATGNVPGGCLGSYGDTPSSWGRSSEGSTWGRPLTPGEAAKVRHVTLVPRDGAPIQVARRARVAAATRSSGVLAAARRSHCVPGLERRGSGVEGLAGAICSLGDWVMVWSVRGPARTRRPSRRARCRPWQTLPNESSHLSGADGRDGRGCCPSPTSDTFLSAVAGIFVTAPTPGNHDVGHGPIRPASMSPSAAFHARSPAEQEGEAGEADAQRGQHGTEGRVGRSGDENDSGGEARPGGTVHRAHLRLGGPFPGRAPRRPWSRFRHPNSPTRPSVPCWPRCASACRLLLLSPAIYAWNERLTVYYIDAGWIAEYRGQRWDYLELGAVTKMTATAMRNVSLVGDGLTDPRSRRRHQPRRGGSTHSARSRHRRRRARRARRRARAGPLQTTPSPSHQEADRSGQALHPTPPPLQAWDAVRTSKQRQATPEQT